MRVQDRKPAPAAARRAPRRHAHLTLVPAAPAAIAPLVCAALLASRSALSFCTPLRAAAPEDAA